MAGGGAAAFVTSCVAAATGSEADVVLAWVVAARAAGASRETGDSLQAARIENTGMAARTRVRMGGLLLGAGQVRRRDAREASARPVPRWIPRKFSSIDDAAARD
jgi:hypothetical protein